MNSIHASRFNVYKGDANQLVLAGAADTIHFTVKAPLPAAWDNIDEFDIATYTFTPKHAGYYYLGVEAQVAFVGGVMQYCRFEFHTTPLIFTFEHITVGVVGGSTVIHASTIRYLTPNDSLYIVYRNETATNQTILTGTSTVFYGQRVG